MRVLFDLVDQVPMRLYGQVCAALRVTRLSPAASEEYSNITADVGCVECRKWRVEW